MESTAATAAVESAPAESASAEMSGRESVIALHARRASALNSAERAMIAALRRKTSARAPRESTATTIAGAAAEALVASKRRCAPESGRSAVASRNGAISVRDTQAMRWIVRPDVAEAAMEIGESEAVEEIGVQDYPAAKPVKSPAPAPPAPQSPGSAE